MAYEFTSWLLHLSNMIKKTAKTGNLDAAGKSNYSLWSTAITQNVQEQYA